MDNMMAQLLANQLGIATENGYPQPNEIAAALASQTSDPMMAALLGQMASRKPAANAEDVDAEHQDCEREMLRLKKLIARLKQEVASANVMARYIADTFGACPACWGLNRLCQQCQGKGKPGYADPDLEELQTWVEPALRKGGLYIAHLPKT
jgi:hypothetical protein